MLEQHVGPVAAPARLLAHRGDPLGRLGGADQRERAERLATHLAQPGEADHVRVPGGHREPGS